MLGAAIWVRGIRHTPPKIIEDPAELPSAYDPQILEPVVLNEP